MRPCIIGHTLEANSALQANWIFNGLEMTMLSFLIRKYDPELDAFVKRFTATMARRFDQAGIFTGESQLDISFEGMPTLDTEKLWVFDCALIPQELAAHYLAPPHTHRIKVTADSWEAWYSDKWEKKNQ